MKKIYPSLFSIFFTTALLLCGQAGFAQCVSGGTGSNTAYDTTIRFMTGATTQRVKFPKFDPQTGMVTCVKLIVTVVGVVDTVGLQNYSASPQTANFYYNRTDQMTGPGLTSPLSNTFNGNYGPYALAAYDGSPGTGPDFRSASRDTVLRQSMTRQLTDSTEISQFYGASGDSVSYNYNINVSTSASITGGSSASLVLTSALVNFRFEYCTCPLATLPVGLKNFSATRAGANTAGLRWEAEKGNDNYYYAVEVSRDGNHFTREAVVNKQMGATAPTYQHGYSLQANAYGRYYFRIKQQWLDGYYRYSEVKQIDFANPLSSTISLYPNPSAGQVGLKFVAVKPGLYEVRIANAGGQMVLRKEMQVKQTDLKTVAALQKGMYYITITEMASGVSCVQRLSVQ